MESHYETRMWHDVVILIADRYSYLIKIATAYFFSFLRTGTHSLVALHGVSARFAGLYIYLSAIVNTKVFY